MKRLLVLLLIFTCIFNYANSESLATPSDLCENFEPNDWGQINIEFERKVYIDFLQTPIEYGDEAILVAVLVDFHPNDKCEFIWEESENGNEWWTITNENNQTYSFIFDETNAGHYWRVKVNVREG